MTESLTGRGWRATVDGANIVLALTNDWSVHDTTMDSGVAERLLGRTNMRSMVFDSSELGRWDSSLLVFLSTLRQASVQRRVRFDETGLPAAARQLLALLPDQAPAAAQPARRPALIERVGASVIALWAELIEITAMVGESILGIGAALRGRARMRGVDLLECMRNAGLAALPMVALVNLLVGGILAFVGAVELRRFGAAIYVANLVGVAEVREMAALMTAIVMSGRTGGAYAAEISTMQGTEEIDALRVIGIPVHDYLILPRVLALTAMMPLLYLYGCAIGIVGGFVVAVAMLNISPETFIEQARGAVAGREILFGLTKSVAFGALIGIAGCRIGMKAGRSASDVGHAATSAVVVGIVGIFVLDAVFAVCANALDI